MGIEAKSVSLVSKMAVIRVAIKKMESYGEANIYIHTFISVYKHMLIICTAFCCNDIVMRQ